MVRIAASGVSCRCVGGIADKRLPRALSFCNARSLSLSLACFVACVFISSALFCSLNLAWKDTHTHQLHDSGGNGRKVFVAHAHSHRSSCFDVALQTLLHARHGTDSKDTRDKDVRQDSIDRKMLESGALPHCYVIAIYEDGDRRLAATTKVPTNLALTGLQTCSSISLCYSRNKIIQQGFWLMPQAKVMLTRHNSM